MSEIVKLENMKSTYNAFYNSEKTCISIFDCLFIYLVLSFLLVSVFLNKIF